MKSSYVDQYPEDLVNCTGELEISSVSGSISGKLAYMTLANIK